MNQNEIEGYHEGDTFDSLYVAFDLINAKTA